MSAATARWFAPAISGAAAPTAAACRPSPAACAASSPPAASSRAHSASASACAAPGAADTQLQGGQSPASSNRSVDRREKPSSRQPAVESRRFGGEDHVAFLLYQQI